MTFVIRAKNQMPSSPKYAYLHDEYSQLVPRTQQFSTTLAAGGRKVVDEADDP